VTGTVTCADTKRASAFCRGDARACAAGERRADQENARRDMMNSTATTDLEGRFVIEKVPVGRYFVVGLLPGYHGAAVAIRSRRPRKDEQRNPQGDAQAGADGKRRAEPGSANEPAPRSASELSGTVLYDDGSPAIHLLIHLLHKDKNGEITSVDGF